MRMDSIRTANSNYLGSLFLIDHKEVERASHQLKQVELTTEHFNRTTRAHMRRDVSNLARTSRTSINPENTQRALQYIAAVLTSIGYQPKDTLYQRFIHVRYQDRAVQEITPQANLVLKLGNDKGKQIIIGAHYVNPPELRTTLLPLF